MFGNEEITSSTDSSGEEMARDWQYARAVEEDNDTLLCDASELHSSDDQKETGGNHNGYHSFIPLFPSFLEPLYHSFLLFLCLLQCHNASSLKT